SPIIRAEIGGLDLTPPLRGPTGTGVGARPKRDYVLFFRAPELPPAPQAQVAPPIGHRTEGHPGVPGTRDEQDVPPTPHRADRAKWWHADVTFLQEPALASILYMVEAPAVGGDTMWASLQDAYDGLAEPVRAMCDRLLAIHFDPWFAADVDARGGYRWNGEW